MFWATLRTKDNEKFLTDDTEIFKVITEDNTEGDGEVENPDNFYPVKSSGVTLYKNSSAPNTVEKSKYLTTVIDTEYYLKKSCTLTDPVITIKYKGFISANYAYIKEFKRFYFITNIVSVNQDYWMVYLHVDVLMSFHSDFFISYGMVLRNEYYSNTFIEDNRVSFSTKPVITYYESDVSPFENIVRFVGDTNNTRYLLMVTSGKSPQMNRPMTTIVGDGRKSGNSGFGAYSPSINMYILDEPNLISLTKKLRTINWTDDFDAFFENPGEQLVSLMALPVSIPTITTSEDIEIGNVTFDGVKGYRVMNDLIFSFNAGKITIPNINNSFFDYNPYRQLVCYAPFIGYFEIDPSLVVGKTLYFKYSLDLYSGNCNLYIEDDSTSLYVKSGSMGISVPLSSTNSAEVAKNKTLGLLTAGLAVATGTVVGGSTGLIIGMNGASSGIDSLGSSTTPLITQNSNQKLLGSGYQPININDIFGSPTVEFPLSNPKIYPNGLLKYGAYRTFTSLRTNYQMCGVGGGSASWYSPMTIFIQDRRLTPLEYGHHFNKLNGKPLGEIRQLAFLHGYTEIGDIRLDNIPDALSVEISELTELLHNGVIFPDMPSDSS